MNSGAADVRGQFTRVFHVFLGLCTAIAPVRGSTRVTVVDLDRRPAEVDQASLQPSRLPALRQVVSISGEPQSRDVYSEDQWPVIPANEATWNDLPGRHRARRDEDRLLTRSRTGDRDIPDGNRHACCVQPVANRRQLRPPVWLPFGAASRSAGAPSPLDLFICACCGTTACHGTVATRTSPTARCGQ